jgi:lycopene beta-cyclase
MICILGGGLAGALLAYRLSQLENGSDFLLIEPALSLGGNHTWSFHESDLTPDSLSWIRPLVTKSWLKQEVHFPAFQRCFNTPYHSITSTQFARVIETQLGQNRILRKRVSAVRAHEVELEDGQKIEARLIIDARGLEPQDFMDCGYQKFLGMDIELAQSHSLKNPVIMDVNCEQKEGYRFFYLLPWTPTSLLIEDTRYTQDPAIHSLEFENEIRDYCHKRSWTIKAIHRTEQAALPIPLRWRPTRSDLDSTIAIGLRGGYFHATTGYSLPYAVEVAETIANEMSTASEWDEQSIKRRLKSLQFRIGRQARFFSILNRMLFLAARPGERWHIFSRFYRFRSALIFRFYRGQLTWIDQMRILMGKPPVPLLKALRHVLDFPPALPPEGKTRIESITP